MKLRKLSAVLIATAIIFGAKLAHAADYKTKLTLNVPKSAANTVYDEAYILTVPEALTVTASGWNALGKITVTRSADMTTSFDVKKQLVVTAASDHNWALVKSGDTTQTIGYTLRTAETDESATTSFTFKAAQINAAGGASQDIGIYIAEDYSSKPAGTYEDYITYTASVESAPTPPTVGGEYTFGKYNNAALTWRVLAVDETNKRALLVTEDAVKVMAYQSAGNSNNWSTSDVRPWLNGEGDGQFLKEFTEAEKTKMLEVSITDGDNSDSSTIINASGSDTVFLLSVTDANNTSYFADQASRVCRKLDSSIQWWLRSPGDNDGHATGVDDTGYVYDNADVNRNDNIFVRPAFWLDLN